MKLKDYVQVNPLVKLDKSFEYPFVEMKDIQPFRKTVCSSYKKKFNGSGSKFNHGDTLFARITPCLENGKTSQYRSKEKTSAWGSSEFIVLREKKNISDNDFIYYLSISNFFRDYAIKNMTGTSGRQRVSGNLLGEYECTFPDLDTQKKISNILSTLDKKIENNEKENKILENIARSIFKSYFANSFEQTKSDKVPFGCNKVKLKDIFEIFGGFAFKSKDYLDKGVFVLRTKNFSGGIAEKLNDDVFLSEDFLISHKNFICEEFDYHLVMVGASIGKTGMIFPSLLPALRNQNMWCFRSRSKNISKFLVKFIVDEVTSKLKNFATGSARDFFKKGDFRNFELVLPNDKILNNFKIISDLLLKKISKNYEQISVLTNLKNILLPRLISGELTITTVSKMFNLVNSK